MLAQKRHTTHWNDKRCIRDTSPDQHSAGLRKHDQTKKSNCVTLQQRPEHAISSNRESNIQLKTPEIASSLPDNRTETVNDRKSARDATNDSARMPLPLRDSPTACHPHHALVPRGNCTISTNVVVTIPREQTIHHQGGRVRFTGVLHLLGASCRHDSLHSFLQSEHFARRGGRLGSLQHRPFCTSR